ncbi:olfactory receptor class A-like protein 1 [Mixophyes fleayi]|uniref:olfactory receptor class A-like protein 1 n=1 Tax=Mixophyes fleayi TaxID=3061075 RepID=UPI003F4E2099
MEPQLIIKAFGFLLLVIFGIPGNVFIFLQFTYIRILDRKLIPTNIILTILSFFNFLVVFARVIPQSLNALGVEDLFDDTKCKLTIYTYRVSRAMSICVTTLLSCHQCILIAPITQIWVFLKQKVTQRTMTIILVFWVINLSTYPFFVLNANARKNKTTSQYALHLIYCDAEFFNYTSYVISGAFYVVRDLIFLIIMTLASSYMVCILLHHERNMKRMKCLHKAQRRSAQNKAARAVVFLVALYVVLFGLDNSLWIYTLSITNVSLDINDVRVFLACSYASLSPILIIATNPKLQLSWMFSSKVRSYQSGHVYCITTLSDSSN